MSIRTEVFWTMSKVSSKFLREHDQDSVTKERKVASRPFFAESILTIRKILN